MKTQLSYKITAVLAALTAAAALSASAQDAAPQTPLPDAKPVVAAPAQSTPDQAATPDQTAPAQTATPDQTAPVAAAPAVATGPDAKEFIRQAYLANEFGIAASQVALGNAQDQTAKDAAQTILNDGMKTRQTLIAAIQGSTSDMHFDQAWTDDYKNKLADLKSTAAAEFDAKYLATQGDVTNQTTDLFSAYAANGTDESVKTFAANTLPTLKAEGDKLESVSMGGQ